MSIKIEEVLDHGGHSRQGAPLQTRVKVRASRG